MSLPTGAPRARLAWHDALLGTPVRQFQLVGLTSVAVAFWLFGIVDVLEVTLPRDGLDGTLADLTAGGVGERWHSFLVALLVWGHFPVLLVLWCWGAVLAVRSAVAQWRAHGAGSGRSVRHDHLPAGFVGWGALALAVVANAAASVTPMTGRALLWDEHYGLTQWVALLWLAVALAMAVSVGAAALRRRRQRLERERRREAGRVAAAERRAAAKDAKRRGEGR